MMLDAVVVPLPPGPRDQPRDLGIGSLSGLAQDPRSGRYLAVSDDRRLPRLVWLDIVAADGRLRVTPGQMLRLRAADGVDARRAEGADLEAVVSLPDGSWVVGEEGHYPPDTGGTRAPGEWPPALLTLDPDLRVTRIDDWPARFGLGPERRGVRSNQGFESLTRTPDGRLIAGLERPLYTDLPAPLRNGRPFSGGRGGRGRLVEAVHTGQGWEARREWVYPIDPTRPRDPFTIICNDGENGLTELLALDDTRLLALERACFRRPDTGVVRNTAQIYLVQLQGADDVSPAGRVTVASARPVAKTLLVDFDALIPRLPPELVNLDNFEGLAFGPPSPGGQRTVLVLSDDNFLPTQRTVVVWFEVKDG
jgi:hypothetical protein